MRRSYNKAVKVFREFIARHADYQLAWEQLGRCYEKMGKNDAALKTWGEVLEQRPNDEIAKRAVQRIRHGTKG